MNTVVETSVTPLPDLSALVAAQFSALAASGAIEKMIETQLSKTIEDVLKDQLRSYSDFGKAVRENVEAALKIGDLEKLPNYGEFVGGIIAKNVDYQLHGAWAQKLEADIKELFIDAPESITLETLVEAFKKHVCDDIYRQREDSMTLHLGETTYGSRHVYMDRESDKEKYQCAIRFLVREDGSVFALTLDDQKVGKDLFIGSLDAFERLLMRIYVIGSKVIVHPDATVDDFELSYSNDD